MERTRHPGVAVAIAIALLALAVSLSGSVYAAVKINGKDIKKASIAGKKLKPDGVTGKQVKESTLGTVPSASTLAGVGPGGFVSSGDRRRFRFQETRTTGDITKPLLSLGSLRLTAECNSSRYEINGTTTTSGASYDVGTVYFDPAVGGDKPYENGAVLTSTPTGILDSGSLSVGNYYREVGTIVYNSDLAGETITISLAVFVSRDAGSTYCYIAGTAERVAG